MAVTEDARRAERADVELRVPADSAYAAVLRTITAGLAARLDFTIDDIEDLRIAVGEAGAMVLPQADPGSDLTCSFHLQATRLTLTLTVSTSEAHVPDYDSFAWQVLTTLASDASVHTTSDSFSVTLTMDSSLAAAGL